MGRKVFISVLGAGLYEECKYISEDFESEKVRFIQEATLYQIGADHWSEDAVAIILLTAKAKKENWNRNITERINFKKEIVPYEGLESRLEKMKLPFIPVALPIPDGSNEGEMWNIFEILYDQLQEGDELYFDQTHAFRYLPMLVLVLCNYSKFLKKTTVKHISYGNYEARDITLNKAPIVNLLQLSSLQDWTYAAANYLENGNVDRLVSLCNTTLAPILFDAKGLNKNASALSKYVKYLNAIVDERRMCRGINIVESTNVKSLKNIACNLKETVIKPFRPVLEQINQSLDLFDVNTNPRNGFEAAKWCFQNGLYQQAATVLHENVVTSICFLNQLEWKVEKDRALINIVFQITVFKIPEEKWKLPKGYENDINNCKNKIIQLLQNKMIITLSDDFVRLSELRNDFNHSGMRNNPLKADGIKDRLLLFLQTIPEKFSQDFIKPCSSEVSKPILINYSNHPSTNWGEAQLAAGAEYGEIVDIPFPQVESNGDEEYITDLAERCCAEICLFFKEHLATERTVHVMGEPTLVFEIVIRLKQEGITCLASTTTREAVEENGIKTSKFSFNRFRRY